MASFDVFLSHTWASGAGTCLLLREVLTHEGFSVWYDRDGIGGGATHSGMAAAVQASHTFILYLSDGVLASSAVQWEVFNALGSPPSAARVLLLAPPGGGTSAALAALAQQARAFNAEASRQHWLTEAHLETLLSPCTGGAVLELRPGAAELPGSLQQLLARLAERGCTPSLGVPPPTQRRGSHRLRLARTISPSSGSGSAEAPVSDLLLLSGPRCALQLEFLRVALLARCPALRLQVLTEGTEAEGSSAARGARFVLLIPTVDRPAAALGALQALSTLPEASGKANLLLLHEQDAVQGGAFEFKTFLDAIHCTTNLGGSWSAWAVAAPFDRDNSPPVHKRDGMVLKLLATLGASPWGEGGPHAPPSLRDIPYYSEEAIAGPLSLAAAAVLGGGVRVAVLGGLGGMGKSTVAAALAARAEVRARFELVVWLTVGRGAGRNEVREGLISLLKELDSWEEGSSSSSGDERLRLESLVDAVRRTLETGERAVLLVADDLAQQGGDELQHFNLLASAAPRSGPSRMLITTREVAPCALAVRNVLKDLGPGAVAEVPMEPLPLPVAVGMLRASAGRGLGQLLGAEASEWHALAAATMCTPLALQIAAGALRGMLERPNGSTREDSVVVRELALALQQLLQPDAAAGQPDTLQSILPALRASSTNAFDEGAQAPIFRAIQAVFLHPPCDVEKFAAFGLFEEDAEVPVELLGVAWGMGEGDEARRDAVLRVLASASLLKVTRGGACVQLHDLPWEYARALGGGRREAHANFVQRCGVALLEEGAAARGEWWRVRGAAPRDASSGGGSGNGRGSGGGSCSGSGSGGGSGGSSTSTSTVLPARVIKYVFERLPHHLRQGGKENTATELQWRLPWLLACLKHRGRAGLIQDVGDQIACVAAVEAAAASRGGGGGAVLTEEATAAIAAANAEPQLPGLKLLRQTLAMAGEALEGEGGGAGMVAHLHGRLGALDVGIGKTRVAALLAEAYAWDGGGRPWLRLVRPNFMPPGDACEYVFEGHKGEVNGVCVVEGGLVVSASSDSTLRVWNADSGRMLRVLEGHTAAVQGVCAMEGRKCVSTSGDKTLRLWDAATGACLSVMEGHFGGKNILCDLGNGQFLVNLSCDEWKGGNNTMSVWDVTKGACMWMLEGHADIVTSLCALGDKQHVVSASDDKSVRVWDASTGMCVKVLEGHAEKVKIVCELGDKQHVVSASRDKTLRVWNAKTGICVSVLKGHSYLADKVCALGDGLHVLSAVAGEMFVWKTSTGECVKKFQSGRKIECMAVLGQHVFGANSSSIHVWDATTGEYIKELVGHTNRVTTICPLGDGLRVISTSFDKTLRAWNDGLMQHSTHSTHSTQRHIKTVLAFCALENGVVASIAEGDKNVMLWDASTGEFILRLEGHDMEVNCIQALAGGRLLSASTDGNLRIWNICSGECLEQFSGGHTSPIVGLVVHNGICITLGKNLTLSVWDLDKRPEESQLLGQETYAKYYFYEEDTSIDQSEANALEPYEMPLRVTNSGMITVDFVVTGYNCSLDGQVGGNKENQWHRQEWDSTSWQIISEKSVLAPPKSKISCSVPWTTSSALWIGEGVSASLELFLSCGRKVVAVGHTSGVVRFVNEVL